MIDASGNLDHAINGLNTSADANDCSVLPDGTQFNGNCHLSLSGLNISSRGFSFDLFIQLASSSSGVSDILRESADKFAVTLEPSTKTITVTIGA